MKKTLSVLSFVITFSASLTFSFPASAAINTYADCFASENLDSNGDAKESCLSRFTQEDENAYWDSQFGRVDASSGSAQTDCPNLGPELTKMDTNGDCIVSDEEIRNDVRRTGEGLNELVDVNMAVRQGLRSAAGEAGYGTSPKGLTATIGSAIQVLLGLLGIAFLILTLYAGTLFLTAAGDPDKAKKGKQMLVMGAIGMIVIVASYALATFVIDALTTVVKTT